MQEPTRNEVETEIIQSYLALGDSLRLTALPVWVTAELNLSQVKAVVLLEHYGSLTISELAKLLNLGNSAASILVQQLVEQGLVERSEGIEDRRRTYVRPTAQGIGLITGRREVIKNNLLKLFNHLDDEELLCLQRGLGALYRVLQTEHTQEGKALSPVDEKP